jgi:hypothetical protein
MVPFYATMGADGFHFHGQIIVVGKESSSIPVASERFRRRG